MDPITLAVLAGVGGATASNLPALLPSKLARENKKRLEALKRRGSPLLEYALKS